MHKKKILFLGYFCDELKNADSVLSNADNYAQLGYIDAIKSQFDVKLVSTNNINNNNHSYISKVHDKSTLFIGGNNIFSRIFNLYNNLKKDKDRIVIYYNNLFMYNLVCYLLYIKYKIKFIPIIITEPFNIKNANIIKKSIYMIQKILSEHFLKYAYGQIKITNQIKDYCKNSIVINGGIDDKILDKYKNLKKEKHPNISIVYTGALYYRYNLEKIIAAVNQFDGNIKFYIYGNGEDLDKIIKLQNNKIKYCGNVSREEIMQVQKNSDILVAILNDDELSKKTFPSKIFEYIATGNEVIMSNLEIVNEDIKQFCHIIDNIDVESILKCIKDITVFENKKNISSKSFKILKNNYTWSASAKKISGLIERF